MSTPTFKPIHIGRTEGEWDIILAKIEKMGGKDLSAFIRSEVQKLLNNYNDCPECICKATGEKRYKRPYISTDSYNKLAVIAKKMRIPVSAIVNNFIVTPLLTRP